VSIGARSAPWPQPRSRRIAGALTRTGLGDGLVIGAAMGCWIGALARTDLGRMAGWGLFDAVPVGWLVALVLLAGGFALAAARERPRPAVLAAYVIALLVVLDATTAVLYPEARFSWTYKHLGVIDYIARHGAADRTIDIYQNWPGFFALNAWLSKVAGISPLAFAPWAQLFFGLANVSAVVFALRGLTRDVRLQWSAAWLFVVANWIGQDYLSPQAFTFFLSVVTIGIIVRCAPLARPPRARLSWLALRITNRITLAALRGRRPQPRHRAVAPLGTKASLAVAAMCFAAVVLSHQLSPMMLIASAAVLAVTTRRPPVWVLATMVAIEVWWVALGYEFISRHFRLLDFQPSVSARDEGAVAHPLHGVELAGSASRLTIAVLVVLAIAGVVRRLRAGHSDLTAALLIIAPAIVVSMQSYGGEGPLRLYLFALPWLSFFAASLCSPPARARRAVVRAAPLFAATAVLGAGALLGAFGQETLNHITTDDVAVSTWFYDRAPETASLTLASPNFPDRINAGYVRHLDEARTLVQSRGFAAALVGHGRTHQGCDDGCALRRQVEVFLDRDRHPVRYLVLSPSQDHYLFFQGFAPRGATRRLARTLLVSPRFRVAYRRGAAVVLSYRTDGQPGSDPGRRRTSAPARR
jgi:hypothetical protein